MLKLKLNIELGLPSSKLDILFNHKDHQNVPNAVELLTALHRLSEKEGLQDKMENQGLATLGHFTGLLVRPFTDPEMSLSDQLTSLSAAGHMLLVLYRRNRTSFCPGQFYYDTQSFIKATFWNVAKQKLLHPAGQFFIIQGGSDRLEGSFGEYRTADHCHNIDLLQLQHRSSQIAEVQRIFAEHPDIDRGHRRLNLKGNEGVDHTNPRSWIGDVTVASVSLRAAWNAGRRKAQSIFNELSVPCIDFASLPLNVDLLRPFGDYVGLREDVNSDFDGHLPYPNIAPTTRPSIRPTTEPSDVDMVMIELEDHLPEMGDDDLDSVQKNDSNWLLVDDKMVHKGTAVRYMLYSEDGRKSTDRPSRAAGMKKIRTFSRVPDSPSLNDDSLLGDVLIIGQLVASFIRIESSVVLAIVRVSAISNDTGESVASIPCQDLGSDVTLQGQVLTLECTGDKQKWHWTGTYENFPPEKQSKAAAKADTPTPSSKKSTVIKFPASLSQTVKQKFLTTGNEIVTEFDGSDLQAITEFLWLKVSQHAAAIPSRKETKTYPCRDGQGTSKECPLLSFLCLWLLQTR